MKVIYFTLYFAFLHFLSNAQLKPRLSNEKNNGVPIRNNSNSGPENHCDALIMLEKMNVFYIGVDNPVTIGSPDGWDNTYVSISGGTISGYGSSRIVRVNTLGKVTISVNTDKNTTNFEFRVKKIPDPVFKVGSGKARMPSVEFKSQQFCRAELQNFDFDVRYVVVGATVFFSGSNFPVNISEKIEGNSLATISTLMSRCGPGSVITFDNVKVQGPDGVRTIEGYSIALY